MPKTPDVSYYGHYSEADLFEGACQAFEKARFAIADGDRDLLDEANEQGAKFAAALRIMRERAAQRFLH